MAITIEGYTVVAKRDRIQHLLETHQLKIPNATAFSDDDLWRCCFMVESDANAFIESLEVLGMNISQGPDSDVIIVSERDRSIRPYCEWLVTAKWERAVIAWKVGTLPKTVVARVGWDPKIGSGLRFADTSVQCHLEFLRVENNVEVFRNKETGEEVFIGRTSTPIESLFKIAAPVIKRNFRTAGEKKLTGQAALEVTQAVESLEKVVSAAPGFWNAHWFLGKGHMALGNYEKAYQSLRHAYNLEKNLEPIPRELAGVCLQLGKFDEAVAVAQYASSINPTNAGLISNLALAYLLAGQLPEASRSIAAATKLDPNDPINKRLETIIRDVVAGKRPQPTSLASLSK